MQITIRTEYAGVPNAKKDLKRSEKIAKKFKFNVLWVSDKAVCLEMNSACGQELINDHRKADISYLISEIV